MAQGRTIAGSDAVVPLPAPSVEKLVASISAKLLGCPVHRRLAAVLEFLPAQG
jgi:hypothetical protein